MNVTLYTKPACPSCTATKRALDKLDLPYALVDISEDATARDLLLGLGYRQAPVVIAGDHHWAGYRPDRLKALANQEILSAAASLVSA